MNVNVGDIESFVIPYFGNIYMNTCYFLMGYMAISVTSLKSGFIFFLKEFVFTMKFFYSV